MNPFLEIIYQIIRFKAHFKVYQQSIKITKNEFKFKLKPINIYDFLPIHFGTNYLLNAQYISQEFLDILFKQIKII